MKYSYDRRKTARMDLYSKWRDIIERHEKMERKDFDKLLRDVANHLKTVGYFLDVRKSWISKYYAGSDGVRMEGSLTMTADPQSTTVDTEPRQVENWMNAALDMHGSAKKNSDDSWTVDITSY